MRIVDVPGRVIRDLAGLQQALVAGGFLVSHIGTDENKTGSPYTRVWLFDTETKDPTAAVQAFADKPARTDRDRIVLASPDGTRWAVTVNDAGALSARRL